MSVRWHAGFIRHFVLAGFTPLRPPCFCLQFLLVLGQLIRCCFGYFANHLQSMRVFSISNTLYEQIAVSNNDR